MKFSAIVAAAFGAASVTAAPAPVEKRGGIAIAVWADRNFAGRQQNFNFGNRGDCLTLGNGWDNTVSSFVVMPGWTCVGYFDPGCKGTVSLPAGNAKADYAVSYVGDAANDKWSSIKCY